MNTTASTITVAAADPSGCGACGIAERPHGRQHTEPIGWHPWLRPTDAQRLARMRLRLAPLFTLTYTTAEGEQRREPCPARAVETIGRLVARFADRGEAWDIAVTDAAGTDVTADFACFQD